MPQNRLLAKMVDGQDVTLVEAGVEYTSHDGFIVWEELRITFHSLLLGHVTICLLYTSPSPRD